MTTSLPASSKAPTPDGELTIRGLQLGDRDAIERILLGTDAFEPDEIRVAMELVDEGSDGTPDGYRFAVAELGGEVLGYACFGHTPCTEGVYDLYWIAVDKSRQSKGVGRRLVEAVEAAVRTERGRMLLIETASKAAYAATRAFYLRTEYTEVARIKDFYKLGDDKIIYSKNL